MMTSNLLHPTLNFLGHVREFDGNFKKYYLVKLGIGMPIRGRLLRKHLRTASEAQDYGWRVIFRHHKIFHSPLI